MQKLLTILAFFFTFSSAFAQKEKLDQLFEKYQETEGVTSIKIAKPMFNMLNKLNIDDAELDQIKPLLSKINGLKILLVEKPDSSAANSGKNSIFQNLQADIANSIKKMNYEELITVNSKKDKIKFLSSDSTNGVLDNLLLNISSNGSTVLMMLDGKISMDDVNKLVNEAQNSSVKSSVRNENTNSGGVTQVRNVGKFNGVRASSGIKVNFTQGNNQSVVVDTDPNLQQYVKTEVEKGILVLSIDNKNNKNLNFKKLLVTIEAPHLSSVDLSSGSSLTTVTRLKEDNFKATLSSGSNFNGEVTAQRSAEVDISSGANGKLDINAQNLNLNATSGSMITVIGKAENAVFNVTSAAACNAQDFIAKSAIVSATSAANLKIHATDTLEASAESGASVRYKGSPKIVKSSPKEFSGATIKPLK